MATTKSSIHSFLVYLNWCQSRCHLCNYYLGGEIETFALLSGNMDTSRQQIDLDSVLQELRVLYGEYESHAHTMDNCRFDNCVNCFETLFHPPRILFRSCYNCIAIRCGSLGHRFIRLDGATIRGDYLRGNQNYC